MRSTSTIISALAALGLATWTACSDSKDPAVKFTESSPIGRWAHSQREPPERDAEISDAARSDANDDREADSGPSAPPASGTGGRAASDDAGANPPSTAAPLREVTFSVTTLVQHRKPAPPPPPAMSPDRYYYDHAYGPINIGAIWIEDAAGGYVKTLAVWGGERGLGRAHFLHLVGFTRAFGSADPAEPRAEVDVVASATLKQHETHEVIWRHRDREGEPVEPGDYVLKVEVADFDTKSCQPKPDCESDCEPPCEQENALCEVAFDTTGPRGSVKLDDTMYCKAMQLRLE